jgi:hypothetical protein
MRMVSTTWCFLMCNGAGMIECMLILSLDAMAFVGQIDEFLLIVS